MQSNTIAIVEVILQVVDIASDTTANLALNSFDVRVGPNVLQERQKDEKINKRRHYFILFSGSRNKFTSHNKLFNNKNNSKYKYSNENKTIWQLTDVENEQTNLFIKSKCTKIGFALINID